MFFSSPKPAPLRPEVFGRLQVLLRRQTGLRFRTPERCALLEQQLRGRLEALGLNSFEVYLHVLQGQYRMRELPRLVDAVTASDTVFFRSPAHYRALEEHLLPEIVRCAQENGRRTVCFWSAACASGEEPYTLAMILKERIQPQYPEMRFRVEASDINQQALRHAQAGIYSAEAVRNTPAAYLHEYFLRHEGRYMVRPDVRNMVSFQPINLIRLSDSRHLRGIDVAVCANVLDHFGARARPRTVKVLYQSLRPGGYLLLGLAEKLRGVKDIFRTKRFGEATVYQRPLPADQEELALEVAFDRVFAKEASDNEMSEKHILGEGGPFPREPYRPRAASNAL